MSEMGAAPGATVTLLVLSIMIELSVQVNTNHISRLAVKQP
ncbi:hypothetical protein GUI43_04638 [Micromonospora noduli]|nr:hypothetical protein GUI43_04638 [Micromonospora noduli]RAO36759.1 hypothetical protein ONO23_01816 [Micromonospora noduli]RAO52583.1 hypothetical protein ONO86_01781 [Micromonospora noduli]